MGLNFFKIEPYLLRERLRSELSARGQPVTGSVEVLKGLLKSVWCTGESSFSPFEIHFRIESVKNFFQYID